MEALLALGGSPDVPLRLDRPAAALSRRDSLQAGGVEGELFGGVGYRRDDFRNLTLEEERASIRESNALPLLPPIGELPSTDPE
ncbi:hypothetical protein BU14_0199s0003 [Porphyra umbilicalis]|uniref:Uncharacterized protein n=1 Tax=Porphyra umbilicalis TaxID=2786 RepID=A0A1X6P6B0_PORUM|nr:hypothetical protein BU14_0199s0003 [Porphyra umbilicalis]|eukprot:OSX76296.1 hypothetical protein BU14_0199s0003 [Porphyra umbilicalis]